MISKLSKFGHWSFSSLFAREIVRLFGSLREKEKFGLLARPQYAYGLLRAADTARYFGVSVVTCCEFGVAAGAGLENMCDLSDVISKETGIKFLIYGFDTGAGLPDGMTCKDHPEMWMPGDFPMGDTSALERRMNGRASLIFGNIADTIGEFTANLSEKAPVGFIAVDVDIYTGARDALRLFDSPEPKVYLPATSVYFDDVLFYFSNRWCGELAAIEEFNATHGLRKIDADRSLPGDRALRHAMFYPQMYAVHILDHPARNTLPDRPTMDIPEHHQYMSKKKI